MLCEFSHVSDVAHLLQRRDAYGLETRYNLLLQDYLDQLVY
jgi:hypothetical protein